MARGLIHLAHQTALLQSAALQAESKPLGRMIGRNIKGAKAGIGKHARTFRHENKEPSFQRCLRKGFLSVYKSYNMISPWKWQR